MIGLKDYYCKMGCDDCEGAIAFSEMWMQCRFHVCLSAARWCSLACLKRAREKGYDWNSNVCWALAERGMLEALKWAHNNGCRWDALTCQAAAVHGHLDCLKWARTKGCPWNRMTTTWASAGGQLHCLVWAVENGCDWSSHVCLTAALNGKLDCLKWALMHGCGFDNGSPLFNEKAILICRATKAQLDHHARKIQRAWLDCYWNPDRSICKRRIQREYDNLKLSPK